MINKNNQYSFSSANYLLQSVNGPKEKSSSLLILKRNLLAAITHLNNFHQRAQTQDYK